jgi:acyl-CoA thioester hydrolase
MKHPGVAQVIHEAMPGEDMVDANGHVGDVGLARIFAQAETRFLARVEVDAEYRQRTNCSVYTAETRVAYRPELKAGTRVVVRFNILDLSKKAVHLLFAAHDGARLLATHECLMLHVDRSSGAPVVCSFDRYVLANLVHLRTSTGIAVPQAVPIGIRRNS